MERIIIEVDSATAKNWRNISPKFKIQLGKRIGKEINHISQKMKEANFEDLLKEARKEAAKNGLTEDILQKLLNEE